MPDMSRQALISIDCHTCSQHIFIPVTITNRSEITHTTDGRDTITFTVETPDLYQRLIQHMDH